MTLVWVVLILASVVGLGEGGKPKAFPVVESQDRTKPIQDYLVYDCKRFESNCNHSWNKEGTCKDSEKSVICKQGYYLGNPVKGDKPGVRFCYKEQDRPYTCEVSTPAPATTTGKPISTTTPGGQCPRNEVFERNSNCPEWHCSMVLQGKDRSGSTCSHGNITMAPGCHCAPNFARNDEGVCVPEAFCTPDPTATTPPCSKNSYYEECPQCNDLKCSEIASFDKNVPVEHFGHPSEKHRYCLAPRCLCIKGYARDDDENCVEITGTAPNACAT